MVLSFVKCGLSVAVALHGLTEKVVALQIHEGSARGSQTVHDVNANDQHVVKNANNQYVVKNDHKRTPIRKVDVQAQQLSAALAYTWGLVQTSETEASRQEGRFALDKTPPTQDARDVEANEQAKNEFGVRVLADSLEVQIASGSYEHRDENKRKLTDKESTKKPDISTVYSAMTSRTSESQRHPEALHFTISRGLASVDEAKKDAFDAMRKDDRFSSDLPESASDLDLNSELVENFFLHDVKSKSKNTITRPTPSKWSPSEEKGLFDQELRESLLVRADDGSQGERFPSWGQTEDTLFLAYRGSVYLEDWGSNFSAKPVTLSEVVSAQDSWCGAWCGHDLPRTLPFREDMDLEADPRTGTNAVHYHDGFLQRALTAARDLSKVLDEVSVAGPTEEDGEDVQEEETKKIKTLVITGHSLGAAAANVMASLLARGVLLKNKVLDKGIKIEVVGFETPGFLMPFGRMKTSEFDQIATGEGFFGSAIRGTVGQLTSRVPVLPGLDEAEMNTMVTALQRNSALTKQNSRNFINHSDGVPRLGVILPKMLNNRSILNFADKQRALYSAAKTGTQVATPLKHLANMVDWVTGASNQDVVEGQKSFDVFGLEIGSSTSVLNYAVEKVDPDYVTEMVHGLGDMIWMSPPTMEPTTLEPATSALPSSALPKMLCTDGPAFAAVGTENIDGARAGMTCGWNVLAGTTAFTGAATVAAAVVTGGWAAPVVGALATGASSVLTNAASVLTPPEVPAFKKKPGESEYVRAGTDAFRWLDNSYANFFIGDKDVPIHQTELVVDSVTVDHDTKNYFVDEKTDERWFPTEEQKAQLLTQKPDTIKRLHLAEEKKLDEISSRCERDGNEFLVCRKAAKNFSAPPTVAEGAAEDHDEAAPAITIIGEHVIETVVEKKVSKTQQEARRDALRSFNVDVAADPSCQVSEHRGQDLPVWCALEWVSTKGVLVLDHVNDGYASSFLRILNEVAV